MSQAVTDALALLRKTAERAYQSGRDEQAGEFSRVATSLEEATQSPPPAAGLVEAANVAVNLLWDISRRAHESGRDESAALHSAAASNLAAALTASSAPSGGVVEALKNLVADAASVLRANGQCNVSPSEQANKTMAANLGRLATTLDEARAALSSAPAAQQDVNQRLLMVCKDLCRRMEVNELLGKSDGLGRRDQETYDLAKSVIADAERNPTPPPASQDAAGEGVRWFASLNAASYYEVKGRKATLFHPEHQHGTTTALAVPTIEPAAKAAADGTGFRTDRELTRADVDAIRASWQPPSPGVGA